MSLISSILYNFINNIYNGAEVAKLNNYFRKKNLSLERKKKKKLI